MYSSDLKSYQFYISWREEVDGWWVSWSLLLAFKFHAAKVLIISDMGRISQIFICTLTLDFSILLIINDLDEGAEIEFNNSNKLSVNRFNVFTKFNISL